MRKTFLCPDCKQKLEWVWVYSQCRQRGRLRGDCIVDFFAVDTILDTLGIECPFCACDLMGVVKE